LEGKERGLEDLKPGMHVSLLFVATGGQLSLRKIQAWKELRRAVRSVGGRKKRHDEYSSRTKRCSRRPPHARFSGVHLTGPRPLLRWFVRPLEERRLASSAADATRRRALGTESLRSADGNAEHQQAFP